MAAQQSGIDIQIDALIDALNDGVSGVTFDHDVLETNRPDAWGAVEMTGEDGSEWADGGMIDQTITLDVWVCEDSHTDGTRQAVQRVLRQFAASYDVAGWDFVQRAYLYDLNKVMWRWAVRLWTDEDDWE